MTMFRRPVHHLQSGGQNGLNPGGVTPRMGELVYDDTGGFKVGDGTSTYDNLAYSAGKGQAQFGKTGGRVVTGQIDGTDAAGGATSVALTSFGSVQIPLAHAVLGQGISLATANSITILTDGLYRVSANIRYSGGNAAAFAHVTQIQLNGVAAMEAALTFTGTGSGNVPAYKEMMLSAGDVLTLWSYVESGSVTAVSRVNTYFDTFLQATRVQLAPVAQMLTGFAASSVGLAKYGRVSRDMTSHWLPSNAWSDLSGASMSGAVDLQYFVNKFPNGAVTIGCPLIPHTGNAAANWNTLLDTVTAGTQDAIFTALGTNLAKNGNATVYCRFWWEMNQFLNNNAGLIDATKFSNAWNHAAAVVRTAFNAAARTGQILKFSYSYLIYLTPGTNNEMTLYPGNTYVDVISPDAYFQMYQTTNPTSAAVMTAMKQRLAEAANYAAAKGKPLGIDEWGTHIVMPVDGVAEVRGLGDVPAIVDCMFDWAEQNQVEHMSLYSITDGNGFLSIDNYPNFMARFVARSNAVSTFGNAPL